MPKYMCNIYLKHAHILSMLLLRYITRQQRLVIDLLWGVSDTLGDWLWLAFGTRRRITECLFKEGNSVQAHYWLYSDLVKKTDNE